MKIDELLKATESLLEELGLKRNKKIDPKLYLEEQFDKTLTMHEDFMIEALGSDFYETSPKHKKAVFVVMLELHEILSVQDQLKLPN